MTEHIWAELLSFCDDADLEAWETATYWGSVRPRLEEGLAKLKTEHDRLSSEYKAMVNKLEAVIDLRNELREYRDFMRRASRTHGQANPERWKARMEILDELEKILDGPGSD